MRCPKNRSLLGVNEDFEGEHNDKIHFLFSLLFCFIFINFALRELRLFSPLWHGVICSQKL